MKVWLLLVFFAGYGGHGGGFDVSEFQSQAACETAKVRIVDWVASHQNFYNPRPNATCMEVEK